MKKVNLSVVNGKVQVTHPDFQDEYYADANDVGSCLRQLGQSVQPTPESEIAEVPPSEAAAVLSEVQAQGKSVPAVEIFRARVEQALDSAVQTGRILPRRRDDWRRIALADFDTFSRLMAEQTPRIPLQPIGFSGAGSGDVQAQVKFLAEQRMREKSISYGQALTEIGREQPDLIHQYRRAVSGK